MKKMLLAATALGSLLCCNACGVKTQGPPPGGGGDACTTGNGVCMVNITLTANCTSGSCVTVTPDQVHVGDGTGKVKNVNMLWTLQSGYAFCQDDGIIFKGDTQGQFQDGYATNDGSGNRDSASGGKKNYHWKNLNGVKGTFNYTAKFHVADCSGAAIEKDPEVVNDM